MPWLTRHVPQRRRRHHRDHLNIPPPFVRSTRMPIATEMPEMSTTPPTPYESASGISCRNLAYTTPPFDSTPDRLPPPYYSVVLTRLFRAHVGLLRMQVTDRRSKRNVLKRAVRAHGRRYTPRRTKSCYLLVDTALASAGPGVLQTIGRCPTPRWVDIEPAHSSGHAAGKNAPDQNWPHGNACSPSLHMYKSRPGIEVIDKRP